MRARTRRPLSVARRLLILQLVVFTVMTVLAGLLFAFDERNEADTQTTRKVLGLAETIALFPEVATGIVTGDATGELQARAEEIRETADVDFVVLMDTDTIRLTHPTPAEIGRPYTGHTEQARTGTPFTETYTGSLGPSIRAVAPVYDEAGILVGFVSVGVTRERIWQQFVGGLPGIAGVVAVGVAVTAAGAYLIARRLRHQTLGLDPVQLRRLYEHHDAVLHSIGEGLLVFGSGSAGPPHIEVINDEARRLLDLPEHGPVPFDALPETLRDLAAHGGDVRDEVHLTDDHVLVVNSDPVRREGRRTGTVVTLRDHTELRQVLGELDSAKGLAEALRTQAHETANRLHTIITMVELGRTGDAVSFATDELAMSQALIDRLTASVREPALVALLLGKIADAADRGVELTVTEDTALGEAPPMNSRDLVTLVGNLVDNAIDASHHGADVDAPWVEVAVRQEKGTMIVEVADSGPGMSPDTLARALRRGYSTKSDQRGLGLALVAQVVARHRGVLRTEPSMGSMVVARIPLGSRTDGGEDG
ncbi:MAG: sensor histidine kinase [Rhodococcus sp.]|uniref:sensor histidine kinase n=1 Tax=Rhodococcus TaxID=1827 RepID=UPI0016A54701|nr:MULTISPECIES: sensor histidine kinase [Rhodococcus]NLV79815.1 sensor histidine kinase [Rhodococcus sp. (in: high G+C Gram-positive bacteria)]